MMNRVKKSTLYNAPSSKTSELRIIVVFHSLSFISCLYIITLLLNLTHFISYTMDEEQRFLKYQSKVVFHNYFVKAEM